MTRQAVETGFERFVDDAIEITAEEFSVARALRRGTAGRGGKLIDRLLKNSDALWSRVVQPELDAYRDQTVEQFAILLDCVEAGGDVADYREELLAADGFAAAIESSVPASRRREIEDVLMGRLAGLAEAVEPVVETPEEEFWPAVRASLDADQARALVEEHFAFTWPLRENRAAFALQTSFDPKDVVGGGIGGLLSRGMPTMDVDYTDEAIRAMRRAERKVIADAIDDIDERFADA